MNVGTRDSEGGCEEYIVTWVGWSRDGEGDCGGYVVT